ncbi:MAG: hypothetical protein ACRDT4_22680 [Micromonosporaceae bacterium]
MIGVPSATSRRAAATPPVQAPPGEPLQPEEQLHVQVERLAVVGPQRGAGQPAAYRRRQCEGQPEAPSQDS